MKRNETWRILFIILLGFLSMGTGGFMLYLFFTVGWLPETLAWVLRAVSAVFILASLILMLRQIRKPSE